MFGEFNNLVMTVELLVRIEDLDTGFVTFKVPAFSHFSALLFIFLKIKLHSFNCMEFSCKKMR